MSETIYPKLEDIVRIHRSMMDLMGSPFAPLLHPDRLESALNRPRQLAHYEPEADLFAQAVMLAVGLSQVQAFQDGNKRVAFATADAFLAKNGVCIDGDPITFSCWLICVAGNISDDDLDVVVERLGLNGAAELDAMERERVCRRFEGWLRANASARDPSEILTEGQ